MKKYGITNKIKKKNRSNNANETKQNEMEKKHRLL